MKPLSLSTFALCLLSVGFCLQTQTAMAQKAADPAASAEQTMKTMQSALVGGELDVLWNLFPEEYQSDLNGQLHTFGRKMDPLVWKEIIEVLKATTAMLKKQKTLVLESPLLSRGIKDAQGFSKTYDEIVEGLEMLIASKATKLDKLKQLNLDKFLSGKGKKIGRQMAAIAKLGDQLHAPQTGKPIPPPYDFLLGKVSVTTVEQNGDEATLRFTTAGADGDEDKVQDIKFIKHRGKWLTRGFVNKWDEDMKKMETAIDNMDKGFPSLRGDLATVMKHVNQLDAATTKEEFDNAVKQALIAFLRATGALPKQPQ